MATEPRICPLNRNLGCGTLSCQLCKLCQRRRCEGNFAPKYLAPCDIIEAKCGGQISLVLTDASTGETITDGFDNVSLEVHGLRAVVDETAMN